MNLKKGCEEMVQTRSKWLSEVISAQERVKQLPVEVQELECGGCGADISGETLQITVRLPYELREDAERLQWTEQTKIFLEQALGIVWEKQIGCYEHSISLFWVGKADNLLITISNAPKPPHCKIVETREHKEVITYRAECPEKVTT